jgi:hypothetical protein
LKRFLLTCRPAGINDAGVFDGLPEPAAKVVPLAVRCDLLHDVAGNLFRLAPFNLACQSPVAWRCCARKRN